MWSRGTYVRMNKGANYKLREICMYTFFQPQKAYTTQFILSQNIMNEKQNLNISKEISHF